MEHAAAEAGPAPEAEPETAPEAVEGRRFNRARA
jgi:hypothetical protein